MTTLLLTCLASSVVSAAVAWAAASASYRKEMLAKREAIARHKERVEATHGLGSGSATDKELWEVLP